MHSKKMESGNHESRRFIHFPGLKLARLPLSLPASLAVFLSISEIPFLDSYLPD